MCKNHDQCFVKVPEVHHKIVKYNQDQKYMKIILFIYADKESLLKKVHECEINTQLLVICYLHTIHLTATKATISRGAGSVKKF